MKIQFHSNLRKKAVSVFPNKKTSKKIIKSHSENHAQPEVESGALSMGNGVTVHSTTRHLTALRPHDIESMQPNRIDRKWGAD